MTLSTNNFIGQDTEAEGLVCMLTDGISRKGEDGVKGLDFNLVKIRIKDLNKYEVYTKGSNSKAIIPVIKKKKSA